MLQHLINTTAIWLLSLVIFDAVLRKETFHTYNRIYLLFTLLLGVFLPLWTWHSDSTVYQTTLHAPIQQATILRENIVQTATPSHSPFSWEYCLWFVYAAGVLVSAVLLVAEVFNIKHLYKTGAKTKDGDWTIIETGKDHAPFSLFHLLFVSSRELYSNSEWAIICRHEEKHGSALHFIDLCMIQISRIVFWFHPLVYIYNKRLLLIHEYQADAVSTSKPTEYGQFLIEQALLQPAPSLSHSFNRSPIKKRIIMLTHHTSSYKHSAKLLVLPLLAVSLICCTKSIYSASDHPIKNGGIATYRGNKFEFSAPQSHAMVSIKFDDGPMKNTTTNIERKDSLPVKMNGKPIYDHFSLKPGPTYKGMETSLVNYLLSNLDNDLSKLDDGTYALHMQNIVVDEAGKIVYYDYAGLRKKRLMTQEEFDDQEKRAAQPQPTTRITAPTLVKNPNSEYAMSEVNQNIQDNIAKNIYKLMATAPDCKPGQKDGVNVVSLLCNSFTGPEYDVTFHVNAHRVVSDVDYHKTALK